jgi:hypothetical protein
MLAEIPELLDAGLPPPGLIITFWFGVEGTDCCVASAEVAGFSVTTLGERGFALGFVIFGAGIEGDTSVATGSGAVGTGSGGGSTTG